MIRKRTFITALASLVLLISGCSADAPRGAAVGDHWHASLAITICGERYVAPQFPGGIHTHGDGVIHIHPNSDAEAGDHATLGRFLNNALEGGALAVDRGLIQVPLGALYQGAWRTKRDGDACPNNANGALRVTINGHPHPNFLGYRLQDEDEVDISFR